jgi:hypothetical protein
VSPEWTDDGRRLDTDYVLPLRWTDDAGLDELTGYLRWLAGHVRVVVVDGSPAPVYARHARAWRGVVRHLPPDPDLDCANGKVAGVHTGLRHTAGERLVLADDDVRYDLAALRAVAGLLERVDLVQPQNVFAPLPWHARWDTARSLLNRAAGADLPGTLGLRRSALPHDYYSGDVLFENLELIRTVRAGGGTQARPLGLYVRRLPPTARRFWSQRVRQAYDELARPVRLVAALAVLPAVAAAAGRRGWLLAGAGATVLAAEAGRRRAGGAAVFPPDTPLYAPLWVLERGACAWLAVGARVLRGGVRYGDRRLRVAAHSQRELRRRLAGAGPLRRPARPAGLAGPAGTADRTQLAGLAGPAQVDRLA